MPVKGKKIKYGIPPPKPKRKGSNILDAAMWSEWKTDLAPYSRSPLERLGVNMMANKKNRLLEGTKRHYPTLEESRSGPVTTIPTKDMFGTMGRVLGDFVPVERRVRYSVAHTPDILFSKKGEALPGTVNRETGKISRLKDQPNLPKWMERLAGKQMDSVVHEGGHLAMDDIRGGPIAPNLADSEIEHRVIQTMALDKTGVLERGDKPDRGFMRAVPGETTDLIKRFNIDKRNERISGDKKYWGAVTDEDKAITSQFQAPASKKLKGRGEEDPSTFVDHSKELTKSIGRINKLQNIRETIMRDSLARKPIVTARKINWAT